MAYEEITALLGGWPGFRLVGVRREEVEPERPAPRILLTLEAVPGEPRHCSRCDAAVAEIHDVTPREVRDLPILEADTWLILPRARLKCPHCGPTVEAIPWLDRYQRMTKRFAETLSAVLPSPKRSYAAPNLGDRSVQSTSVPGGRSMLRVGTHIPGPICWAG